jgi:putative chitinase
MWLVPGCPRGAAGDGKWLIRWSRPLLDSSTPLTLAARGEGGTVGRPLIWAKTAPGAARSIEAVGHQERAMPVSVTLEQLARLAPRMQPGYRAAFQNGQGVLDRCGISATAQRVAHFLAQVLHESQALTLEYENLDYSAARLAAVWPSRFRPAGPLDPAPYAHHPRRLANLVYGKRMGNTGATDGFVYRGRGLLQLTGKDSYARATRAVRASVPGSPDFVADPDAVLAPRWCLEVAAAVWQDKGGNELADQGDLCELTRRINGAGNGLAERQAWCRSTGEIWPGAPPGLAAPA